MDQDASNTDAEDQTPPIPHEKLVEQPEAEAVNMDAITTPEGEMDIDLPRLPKTEEEGNNLVNVMRMEVPDSEEASEFSSPVKIAREEKRDEAADLNGGVQMDQQASGQEFDQGNTPKAQDQMMRIEIPDSEEASEFSSPIKVPVFPALSHDETLQADGGLETVGESQEEAIEDEDAAMRDVSALVHDDGMAEGEASRATDVAEGGEGQSSVTRTAVDTKEMGYAMKQNEGLHLSGDKAAELGEGILGAQTQHAATAATSLSLDDTEDLEQETSSTETSGKAAGLLITPVKRSKGDTELSAATTGGQPPISSPALDPREIAISTRKLLADEVSPTISDITETTEQPKSLKGITAIPDSDDDEDDELPDAPNMQNSDVQIPASNPYPAKDSLLLAPTKPAAVEEISEVSTTSGVVLQPAILKQRQEREVATSPQPSGYGNFEEGNTTSLEISSSPTKDAMAPPIRKNAGADSSAKSQSPQTAEDQVAAEPTSSPPKSHEATKTYRKSLEKSVASTIEESSQASDIASSPLDPMKSGSFNAKRKESTNTSFPAPEASQTRDVVIAELKAMKIASIQNRISALETEIAAKRTKLEEVTKDLKQPATETVKRHIKLLHDYNDIRDVGQGLVGMIADNRGVRIGELYEEFGVGLKD